MYWHIQFCMRQTFFNSFAIELINMQKIKCSICKISLLYCKTLPTFGQPQFWDCKHSCNYMQLSGLHNKNHLFRLNAPNVHYIKLWVQPIESTLYLLKPLFCHWCWFPCQNYFGWKKWWQLVCLMVVVHENKINTHNAGPDSYCFGLSWCNWCGTVTYSQKWHISML